MLADVEREAIETAVDGWVREVAIDPRTGVPGSAGGFEITDYRSHLVGHASVREFDFGDDQADDDAK